jgi:hypothetical protein
LGRYLVGLPSSDSIAADTKHTIFYGRRLDVLRSINRFLKIEKMEEYADELKRQTTPNPTVGYASYVPRTATTDQR